MTDQLRPMTEAPRDGTDIIVVSEELDISIVYWPKDDSGWWCSDFTTAKDSMFLGWHPLPEAVRKAIAE